MCTMGGGTKYSTDDDEQSGADQSEFATETITNEADYHLADDCT